MRKKPEIKNYDDRWAEHCHSKLNSKNIAHMNGIVILFHPVCTHTHTHTQFQENTLYLHFFTHAIWNESWLKESAKHWRIKKTTATNWNARHYIKRVWIYNCNVLLKFADCKRKDHNIRERERGRENEPREWKRETERDVQTMLKTKLASIHMFALKKMEETHIPN